MPILFSIRFISMGSIMNDSLRRALAAVVGLIGLLGGWSASAEVDVVTSIKPLALIARPVVGEDGRVSHLLPPSMSPHDYAMKVSDMQRLTDADLVLWVGESLETFLHRPLRRKSTEGLLTLSELDSLHWPEASGSGHDHHGHGHDHGARDPHLWLNPDNAAAVALAVAEKLARLDPPAAERYRARAKDFAEAVSGLDEELRQALKPVTTVPFAVYHDGYSHFIAHYGLNQRAAVTASPEQMPGARHLYELRQTLVGTVCLFTEPYYDMSAARRLAGELGLRLGEVDILGARPEVNSYLQLMRRLAGDMLECLASSE